MLWITTGETPIGGKGVFRYSGFFSERAVLPLLGRESHSMTWLRNVSRDVTAPQAERLAPDIAVILITVLSLVCWVPLISVGMAMWLAFN